MKSIDFSIIIPNLNGAELLPTCLKSLLIAIKKCSSTSGQPSSKFEIILVDNASIDNSISIFKLEIKKLINSLKISAIGGSASGRKNCKLKILQNQKNKGFAMAVNQGIDTAKYNYVVPCNNDIKLNKNWFKIMSQTIKTNPDISTFFGTIKNHDGSKIESTCLEFFNSGKSVNIRTKYHRPRVIWGGNAGLIIYKKKVFQSLGGFDSDFFAYLEDVDLNLRLNQTNHQTLLVPAAISYHLGGATSQTLGNLRQVKTIQNWIYIIVKNYSLKQIWQNFPGIIEQRLRNLSGLLKNTPFLLWLPTVIHTYAQVIIKLPAMLKKRRQILKIITCHPELACPATAGDSGSPRDSVSSTE